MNPLILLFGILGAGAAGMGMRGGKNIGPAKGLGRDDGTEVAPTDGPSGDFGSGETETEEPDAPTGVSAGSRDDAEPTVAEPAGSGATGSTGREPSGSDSSPTGGTGTADPADDSGTGTTDGTPTGSTGGSTTGSTGSTAEPTDASTGGATTGSTDGHTHGTTSGSTGGTTTGSTGGTTTGSTGGSTTGTTTGGTTGSTGGATTGSTGGTTTVDTGTSGHTMGHSTPTIQPPGIGASQTQINTYLAQLAAQPETHVHNAGTSKAPEHDAALNLVPRGAASHVAIGDGDWFDPATWSNGQVPDDGAKVLIPEGVTVNYGGVGDARLFTVRVDGTLDFDTQTDSQMIFDTVVVSPSGHLVIGSPTDPVNPNVDIDLIVANNGPIDTNWDPMLLSRGIVSHGGTSIHGAVKDSHEKVETDPMTGDTSIKFAGVPQGWEVGDTIVVAGTHYDGYTWDNDVRAVAFHPPEDEVRVITAIDSDGTIHLDQALVHDHDAPRADLKTSVANYTRNVSIETENADSAQVFERGHVMFMHSDNVDVRYAEFLELGRTDKSQISQSAESFGQTSFDSNVQGRYALHLHRTGTTDVDDPAIVMGNAVYGSPGWGYVHHDSNALLENNASYDTFGAGFVAETGNEIGAWNDNIAIFAQGSNWAAPKDGQDLWAFDIAKTGDGFWFQGRMVASTDNVAASVNHGFVYFHRDGPNGMIDFDADLFAYPEALFYDPATKADQTPILSFDGNEAFAANQGLHVVKAGPNQGNDVWSHMKDFTAWSVISGAHLEYTSHYILSDFDLVSRDHDPFIAYSTGIHLGTNASDITIVNANVDGFKDGIDLKKLFVDTAGNNNTIPASLHNFVVVDGTVTGADTAYKNYDPAIDRILSGNQLPNLAPDLKLDSQLVLNDAPSNTSVVFSLTGTKTDSLGQTTFPGGTEKIGITGHENTDVHYSVAMRLLAEKGYWTTSGGQNYTLLDIYFTDRVTGEVYVETHPVYVNASVSNIPHNGTQDITTSGGVQFAGSTALDVATLAVPTVTTTQAAAMPSSTMTATHHAMVPDSWLADPDPAGAAIDLQTATATFSSTVPSLAADTDAEPHMHTGPETATSAGDEPPAPSAEAVEETLAVDDDPVFTMMAPDEPGGTLFDSAEVIMLDPAANAASETEAGGETHEEGAETEAETEAEVHSVSEGDGEAAEGEMAGSDAEEERPEDIWCLLTEEQGTHCESDGPEGLEPEEEDEGILFAA